MASAPESRSPAPELEAPAAPSALKPVDDPSHFFNRELSLLDFDTRVLRMARDPAVPLLERLRFLAISCANLDEFFEVRVFGLKQRIAYDLGLTNPERLSAQEVFERVSAAAHRLVDEQYRVLEAEILPALEREGIRILKWDTWDERQRDWVLDYFRRHVLPVLTPVGLDPAHPFPRVTNKSLNFIVALKGRDAFGRSGRIAVVQAPRVLPRLVRVPAAIAGCLHGFVSLSSAIHANVGEIFPGMRVVGCWQFRVTRNSELGIAEEEVEDLLHALKDRLAERRFGGACRLELPDDCPPEMEDFLLSRFDLAKTDLYRVRGMVNLHRLSALYELVDRPELKYAPFIPSAAPRSSRKGASIFDRMRAGDILLHHPFESFSPVLELLDEATSDPDVLAIKQTVYRTGNESPLVEKLLQAAEAGKEVTAVVELRARFDEAANIGLATRLQETGANVVYGIVGYKTHAKMLMIVRRENGALCRYVHLGTGNYHAGTTRAYTDFGLLTCDPEIGEDVHAIFLQLTGLCHAIALKKLLVSPFSLHRRLLELIDAEIAHARAGGRARIAAKMNSLVEPEIIKALYRASQAGVKVDLVVRGICCLRPGLPGLSENIRVRSVLGRFLEHQRIFYFLAGGEEFVYCSSADWMPRNLFHRVEVAFPIESRRLRRRVIDEGLRPYLQDGAGAWDLQPDGSYLLTDSAEPGGNAQQSLLQSLSIDRGQTID